LHYELALLNSAIDNKNIDEIIENGGSLLFEDYLDVWEWIHQFYFQYESIPSKSTVANKFEEFDFINTEDAPLEYYVDEAKKETLAKQVRLALHSSIETLKQAGPQAALNAMTSAGHKIMKDVGILKDTNLVGEYIDRVDNLRERQEGDNDGILGVPSGIKVIDSIYGGWQGGDFIVVLGSPSAGKSWLARLFACNAWRAGYTPLIISLEMNKEQEGYRLDTILNGGEHFTNTNLLNAHGFAAEDYEAWAKTQFEGKHPIYLVTSDGMESANQNVVQYKIDQYKPDLCILDYHQLFDDADRGGTETEKAKNLSKAFKRMAVRNNIPIIDIAAVTMQEGMGERAPELSEVAWSKQLAYDADLVLAIHRDENSKVFEAISRKTRRCQSFAFFLQWDLNKGSWKELYDNV
jgi:replicative DNA helicase